MGILPANGDCLVPLKQYAVLFRVVANRKIVYFEGKLCFGGCFRHKVERTQSTGRQVYIYPQTEYSPCPRHYIKAPIREGEGTMTGIKGPGLFGLGLAFAVLAGVALAQGDPGAKKLRPPPTDVIFEWAVPTTGPAVVKYEVQIRTGGMNSNDITTRFTSTNRDTFPVVYLTLYEVRVRAYGTADIPSPWSPWSVAEDRRLADPDDPE
jgi:hypothetical protein